MIWLWLICSSLLFVLTANGAELATFRGRVRLQDSRVLAVRKGADYSGVVVSLQPPETPSHLPAPARHYEILQKDKSFRPHLLAVEKGAIVDFPNADPIFHNAFSSYSGQTFDVGLYPPGSSRSVRFARAGIVRVFCNIHSSMSAIIVVLETPYFAVTAADGSFAIAAPPGEYTLRVYHERAIDEVLRALTRTVELSAAQASFHPVIVISETGYLPSPHKNKHGQNYPRAADDRSVYPGVRK